MNESKQPSIFDIKPSDAIRNPYSLDGTPLLLSVLPGPRPGLLLKDSTGALDDIEAAVMCQRVTGRHQGAKVSVETLKMIARELISEYEKWTEAH